MWCNACGSDEYIDLGLSLKAWCNAYEDLRSTLILDIDFESVVQCMCTSGACLSWIVFESMVQCIYEEVRLMLYSPLKHGAVHMEYLKNMLFGYSEMHMQISQ